MKTPKRIIFSLIPLLLIIILTEVILYIIGYQDIRPIHEKRLSLFPPKQTATDILKRLNRNLNDYSLEDRKYLLKLYQYQDYRVYLPDPELGWRFNPKAHDILPDIIPLNAFGLRGDLPPINRPSNSICIMVLGGSVVFGLLAPTSFPQELEKELNNESRARVYCLNAGMPGYSIVQSWELYQRLKQYKPDIVIICSNVNNHCSGYPTDRKIAEIIKKQQRIRKFYIWLKGGQLIESSVSRLIGRLETTETNIDMYSPRVPEVDFLYYLDLFNQECKLQGIMLVLITQGYYFHEDSSIPKYMYNLQSHCNQVIWDYSRTNNIPVADIEATINEDLPNGSWLINPRLDDVHPNELGAKYYSKKIAGVLLGLDRFKGLLNKAH